MSDEMARHQETFDLLIEFPDHEGVVQASLGDNLERLKSESDKAMNVAMGVIQAMADRLGKAVDAIEDEIRPNEMEIEFSLKLEAEGGVNGGVVVPLIAKTTAGGQFNIKFKWTLEKPNRPTVLVSENK